jgi:hypothetical protein
MKQDPIEDCGEEEAGDCETSLNCYQIPRRRIQIRTLQRDTEIILTTFCCADNYRFLCLRTAREAYSFHSVQCSVNHALNLLIQVWIQTTAISRRLPLHPRESKAILHLADPWHMLWCCWMCCLHSRRYLTLLCWTQRLRIASVPVGYDYNCLSRARIMSIHYWSEFWH